ncbi:MAG TPA: hypothetical protein VJA66_04725 [Thermoanaerobaculia bacterium]
MAGRLGAGFLVGLIVWIPFSTPYERALAGVVETVLRLTESPPVTHLAASPGEILLDRPDFPPAAPRPGLPAADLHFNFVLLVALFALGKKPWRDKSIAQFLLAAVLLSLVHVAALIFEVRSVYATRLGPWSAAHYGAIGRNFWAGGFHFYQIAGRFAAPFAIWWLLSKRDSPNAGGMSRSTSRRRSEENGLRSARPSDPQKLSIDRTRGLAPPSRDDGGVYNAGKRELGFRSIWLPK